jgi:hypothetical protein
MKRWFRIYPALAAMLLFLLLPSFAQQNSAVRGGLGGVVSDATGAVVPGVTVLITGPQGNYKVQTDATGRYGLTGVVPGSYKVVVEAPGFKKFISDHNQVMVDHTANLDVHLALGAATDTVQVDAGAVQIDAETTSLNAPLSDELYQSLPIARNVAAIFSLAPGVVSGGGTGTANPSIGGATGLENLYLVDGVTVTDQAFGGLGTYNVNFGSLGTGVNLAFIKEVDVKTGAFEPKYGKAAGGIVEIVTKSGSNVYHGAIAAYLGPGAWYAESNKLSDYNYVNTTPATTISSPQYDLALEMGGYVPHLRDKLFFFGAFDPTLNQTIYQAAPGSALAAHGPIAYSQTTLSWAAKLTYLPFANSQLEASTFGDPTHHNQVPYAGAYPNNLSTSNIDNASLRYNYGSRDSVARLSVAFSPSWTTLLSYTYNFNHFDESVLENNYEIQNRSTTPFVTTYVGSYVPTKNDDYSINIETEKKFHFLGEHTLALGYTYEHTNFLNSNYRTGAGYAIPSVNADGTDITSLFGSHTAAIGQTTNAIFRLYEAANSDGTASTTCTHCALLNGKQVYLSQYRGSYAGTNTNAKSRYHVGWVNDSYQMNRWINIDAGLRWEEQWYGATLVNYLFNDNWSPRIGVNIDPFGKHRDKIFFNYARYQSVLPLDAAIRQLGNEQDDTKFYFAPETDSSGNAVLDANGAVTPVLDGAHLLNGTAQSDSSSFGNPSFASSSSEGMMAGTKMEYENEYLLGVQREIVPGTVVSLRYTDRRLGRVIEDIGSQSPEGSFVDGNYAGGIANVNASTDISVNEQQVTYTSDEWTAANGTNTPGSSLKNYTYVAPATGCYAYLNAKGSVVTNDTSVANGGFFQHYDGTKYNGSCVVNADEAGAEGADGKPDGFANPTRRYQEFVVEFNRNLKNNWQMRANYRYAKLWGNYEGFFRNDNGQSDPGISSLFDFTNGVLGLLGDQTTPGFLNTDRRNVGNLSVAYVIGENTPYLSAAKKLNIGSNLRGSSGAPLSAYASHPIYENAGEVPVGGRGKLGRLPSTLQLDLHADYPVQLHDKYTLKLAFDGFNVTNSKFQTGKNQNLDTSLGVSNSDYGKPTDFQGPFYARASIRLQF